MSTTPKQPSRTEHRINLIGYLGKIRSLTDTLIPLVDAAKPSDLERKTWACADNDIEYAVSNLEDLHDELTKI